MRFFSKFIGVISFISFFCLEVQAKELHPSQPRLLTIQWFGHGYFLFTTGMGMKIVIDPFDPKLFDYVLSEKVEANVVLVTHEMSDANWVEEVYGDPQVFRSITGIGVSRGSGMRFMGTRSLQKNGKPNVIFSFKLDGVRFAHLGALGYPLNDSAVKSIGTVDVVIVPVTFPENISVKEAMTIAGLLEAKVIVPAFYATEFSSKLKLGSLEIFLEGQPRVKHLNSDRLQIGRHLLPQEREIWVFDPPREIQEEND